LPSVTTDLTKRIRGSLSWSYLNRSINFRVGFNVLFGCPSTKKEELEAASYAGNPRTGNCSLSNQQTKRKRNYRKSVGL
jgi:hypothetical protein